MQLPYYQVPFLGNGMTIGLDATIHVIFSHGFAIGLVAMVVLSEYLGWKRRSDLWERYAHDMLWFTTLAILGIGAILGVGIWLVTSALEPRGIASMLRIFFWPWFIEWIAFAAEVVVLLVYYFTWARWTGERKLAHIKLGASYILFAWVSAFLITGILGFMMTSDGWPWSRDFFQAFFNPSFWPQLVLRLAASYALGGLLALAYLYATRRREPLRSEATAIFGRITLVSALIAVPAAAWYFAVVPSRFKAHALFSVLTSNLSQREVLFWLANGIGLALVLAFGLLAATRRTRAAGALLIPALALTLAFFIEYERVREFIRGPYLMPGYMYANQVLLTEQLVLSERGVLANDWWYNAVDARKDAIGQGAYLFGRNCAACHTVNGINGIAQRVQGRPEDGIYVILGHTQEMAPFMAPLTGTDAERRALASYLYALTQPANPQLPAGPQGRFLLLGDGSQSAPGGNP